MEHNKELSTEKQCDTHGVICRFFHKITVIDNCHFVDTVSGKSVGKFKCEKCEREYLANRKRSWFRCYS